MWSPRQSVHDECVDKIRAVYAIDDVGARQDLALREIVAMSAYASEREVNFTAWASTIGEAALYPDEFCQAAVQGSS